MLLIAVAAVANGQSVEVIKVPDLQQLMEQESEEVQVINFWATWCAPCIKELPYFEKARESYADKIKVHLVSLDFADQLEKVNRFASRKALKSNLYLLDNVDYNSWINKVDPSWTGAIPATLIINPKTGKRKFVESEMKEEELNAIIKELLTKS
ncbi:MAG: TlpA family protein disulfide reductase [Cytophagales bacterium]|nr:TlpA family protein disulfide reductase [Cytophagales bacterium]